MITIVCIGLLRLLQHMLPFHNHFRHSYAQLMRVVPVSQSLPRPQLESMLQQALQLCRSLDMHHSIEETYIFPLLAPKLPSFGTKDPVHIREHQAMHEKLEDLERYTRKVAQDLESSLGRKSIADGCGKEVPRGTSDDEEQGDIRRKPWPTTLYDADRYTSILTQLGATLFPHLESEEKSLRGNNLKEHGLTLQEISAIPM